MSFRFDLHSAAVSSYLPCHAPTMPFFSRPQHSTAVSRRPCCDLEKNGMVGAWHGQGMASVNQTRPHCVNQMGKTHSKPLAGRHGWGTAWAWHAMFESAFIHHCRCWLVTWMSLYKLQPVTSSVHYTRSCKHSLVLLRMGVIIARNMLS